jgi:orotate phosphoribosyltransferase
MDFKEKLFHFLQTKAIVRGEFILSSGKKSNYYIDGKKATLDAEGIFLTAQVIFDLIKDDSADAIGGPTLGADPIVAAVSLLSFEKGKPIASFLVRAQNKDHGLQRRVEGFLDSGAKVVVVDDVITTGKSILMAIEALKEFDCKVVRTICLVDRQEGASENLKDYNFTPLFRKDELIK